MKYAIQVFAIACYLAIGSFVSGQVAADGPDPNLVVEQPSYDIGIVSVHDKEKNDEVDTVVETPEGKADRIVVFGATWCGPCQSLKTITLPALKVQGYKVEYLDVDKEKEKIAEKYSGIKRGKGDDLNRWISVPTIFYIRDDMIIKKEVGFQTAVHVKKVLWKPDEPTTGPVIEGIEKVRKNLPWNR